MDEQMRDLTCRRLQVDEIWAYVRKKQRRVTREDDRSRVGDQWTFVAIDAETKLVPVYRIGKRNLPTATEPAGAGRYSPPRVTYSERNVIVGSPDEAHISTSMVERQNLTMRMSMRRFTRLTNAFSKKVENLHAAIALHFAHYNFVRLHKTLRTSPAMAAGVSDRLWSLEELVERASA